MPAAQMREGNAHAIRSNAASDPQTGATSAEVISSGFGSKAASLHACKLLVLRRRRTRRRRSRRRSRA